jgi:hypothetical protein
MISFASTSATTAGSLSTSFRWRRSAASSREHRDWDTPLHVRCYYHRRHQGQSLERRWAGEAKPDEVTKTWLRLPFGSREGLQRRLHTRSQCKNYRLAGLQLEPEPCQTRPKYICFVCHAVKQKKKEKKEGPSPSAWQVALGEDNIKRKTEGGN